jgi:hypothetical protein
VPILTREVVHARNWMPCPRCDGGKIFTAREIRQGASCTYCGGKGQVERHPRIVNIWFGYTEAL